MRLLEIDHALFDDSGNRTTDLKTTNINPNDIREIYRKENAITVIDCTIRFYYTMEPLESVLQALRRLHEVV